MLKLDKTAPQSTIGYIFLLMYIVLTMALIVLVATMTLGKFQLPEWANTLLSGIWGGYTAKITTIIDYYFGSSTKDNNHKLIGEDATTVMATEKSVIVTTETKEEE